MIDVEARIAEMSEYVSNLQKQINELEQRVDCLESHLGNMLQTMTSCGVRAAMQCSENESEVTENDG